MLVSNFIPVSHYNFIIRAHRALEHLAQKTIRYNALIILYACDYVSHLINCLPEQPLFLFFLPGCQSLQKFSPPRRGSSYLLQGKVRISKSGSLGLPSMSQTSPLSCSPETGGRPAVLEDEVNVGSYEVLVNAKTR